MFLSNVVLGTWTCLCLLKYVPDTNAQEKSHTNESGEDEKNQKKIALVDIVYTNGEKRTCTGAIIHDHVVITAGHCFMGPRTGGKFTQPELTTSFVVIGNEKKFETGYEQYLPIERVLMHPNVKGFISDVALVHTFASMTADKIGYIMPLSNEKDLLRSKANVTIFSWGRTMSGQSREAEIIQNRGIRTCDECNIPQGEFRGHVQYMSDWSTEYLNQPSTRSTNKYRGPRGFLMDSPKITSTKQRIRLISKNHSRYLPSDLYLSHMNIKPQGAVQHRFKKITSDGTSFVTQEVTSNIKVAPAIERDEAATLSRTTEKPLKNGHPKMRAKSHLRNWRRHIGVKEVNKLTVESYNLMSTQHCTRLLNDHRPKIETNEILCYSSQENYITDEDSGAPVIYKGELLATTVGSFKSDKSGLVAIGMKLSHFCPWIADNLPVGEITLNCWAQESESENVNDTVYTIDSKNTENEDN